MKNVYFRHEPVTLNNKKIVKKTAMCYGSKRSIQKNFYYCTLARPTML